MHWTGLRVISSRRAFGFAGAGHAVPTVRYESEKLCDVRGTLIRINPTDTELPTRLAERDSARFLSLPLGALDALTRLRALVDGPASSSPAGTPEHSTARE